MEDERIAKNPISVNHRITPKNTGAKVNPTLYRVIIGSLMYLTASRPDIMFTTYLCARYQAHPNVNHMLVAKKIMHYLKGTLSLGLWYPHKDGFELTSYSDSDYGGCKRDFKSTSGVNHSKTKHIGIKYHFLRGCYEKKLIDVLQIGTTTQCADLFTKDFDRPRFLFLLNVLGVKYRAEVVSDKELLK
ncbi:uncharacterized mitochondrial protein AtMg00810-like [Rutidosis leptorrhynchoides]|uniref:uncharacterized mitochondrial protein AtMg00810-like n=1 Tax=Rutidosis leptorrhynchoides TaxID=125765 RepID=UPI003A9A0A6B